MIPPVMEIGPIPGIRAIPAIRPRPVHPEVTAFFDIEASARPGDDTYTRRSKKAAGAEENEDDELDEAEDIEDEDLSGRLAARQHHIGPATRLSLFA